MSPFLQPGEVLLHIGPPKTGTTALQHAMAQARPAMKSQGVLYPGGKKPSHWTPSCSALGIATTAHPADPPVPPEVWQQFTARVARRKDRAVVSSEQFADAGPELAAKIVDDLGGPQKVRVLLTLRPLALILPSSWQQSLKSGAPKPMPGPLRYAKSRVVKPYDEWLKETLEGKNATFWGRFDYASLVQRWAGVVGADRVAVIVVDSGDPLRILRDAEQAIGLDTGTLQRVTSKTNRSLSYEEAALVREWLVALERKAPMSTEHYHQWIRRGALWGLVDGRQPGVDEHAIRTPGWALERVDARTSAMIDAIEAAQVRVYGMLTDLIVPAAPTADPDVELNTVPVDVAIQLLMGLATMASRDAHD
ncbi:MAG TPA: hypothetical protein PLT68_02900 [Actinomycetota bacterium]|nr:hypothetical protein [Actinomycetota bacterium]